MLLTVSTTRTPATDLGYLLVKHPDRVQSFDTTGGTAYVWYPEATPQRCTAALLLDVDPVALARPAKGSKSPEGFSLGRYVNDRPYAASSLLTVALGKVFRTALKGTNTERPELAEAAWPLRIEVPTLPCRGGPDAVRRLFAPLGWTVDATSVPLDPVHPEWGDSRYVRLALTGELRLADALNHLYVLLPVLDDAKHYWISADEVEKLLRAGEGWLADHPEKELITRRYLRHRRSLAQTALERLRAVEDEPVDAEPSPDGLEEATPEEAEEEGLAEPRKPLVAYRKEAVLAALEESGAARVLDLGCGEGALLLDLARHRRYTEIVGADVSSRALLIAERRLSRLPGWQLVKPPGLGRATSTEAAPRERVRLIQSALTYHDDRLVGYDAAVLMEVIEHLDAERLPALERAVFSHAAPHTVVVTTPNAEYNVRYEDLTGMRHHDHRFEWTRAEFAAWASRAATDHGYAVEIRPVGEVDPEVGAPTQLAYFRKEAQ